MEKNPNFRKLILYIACSLDGYIAGPGDNLDFLKVVQKEGEDYGYNNFVASIDTVIMGRKTYEWVLNQGYDFPHSDKEAYIITRQNRANTGNITFYNGDIKELIVNLKGKPGKDIFCDGGAEVVNLLLKEKLIDEIILSVVPVMLGNGTRLFANGRPDQKMKLLAAKNFDTGLVQLHYQMIVKDNESNG